MRTSHALSLLAGFSACLMSGNALAAAAAEWSPPATEVSSTIAGPMIEITKNCPQMRYVGRNATFEITVTNKGGAAASNVVVTDTITGAAEFLNADSGGTREGNNIVWRLGTIEAGASKVLSATFRCNTIGRIRNAANVTYCAAAAADCELDVKGIPAILLECVDDPDPIEVGTTTTYTIKVTNQGSETGTNIVIECTLPDEQEHVKSGGATASSVDGQSIKFAPLPTLAPKAVATYTVQIKGIKPGDTRFKVKLTSDQMASPAEETESTHIYQ